MFDFASRASRRAWLQSASAAAGLAACQTTFGADDPAPVSSAPAAAAPQRRLKIAAINSIYRLRSHAYHIVGRFLLGYRRNGFLHRPPVDVVGMYNHQYPADDLSREHCRKFGIRRCDSVEQALGGPDRLDVDGVLIIVEHGDYPLNEFNQVLYPRYEMFERVVEVFRRSGKAVPVFVDKHLSYDQHQAARMVRTARELNFPLMAGSSLPVTWRRPEIEPPLGTPFKDAVCVFGFDRGAPEIYLFHALEVLQCMLERRRGGETGVKSVQCLKGAAVWKAADEGRIAWPLIEAAVARCPSNNIGSIRHNVLDPLAVLVEYRDGTRGAVINLIEQVSEFGFAATTAEDSRPISSCFHLPPPPGARFFDPLCWNIERLLTDGRSPYPVERTLLTSTVLDVALHSLKAGSESLGPETLDIRYQPPEDSGFFRGGVADSE